MPPLPDRGLAVRMLYASVVLVLAASLLALSSPAGMLVGEEREHPPAVPLSYRTELSPNRRVLGGGCLRRLVHDCSRRLNLEGLRCEDDVGGRDELRVPRFDAQPSCGFEVRLVTKTIRSKTWTGGTINKSASTTVCPMALSPTTSEAYGGTAPIAL